MYDVFQIFTKQLFLNFLYVQEYILTIYHTM